MEMNEVNCTKYIGEGAQAAVARRQQARTVTALRICRNLQQPHFALRKPKLLQQMALSADCCLSCVSNLV